MRHWCTAVLWICVLQVDGDGRQGHQACIKYFVSSNGDNRAGRSGSERGGGGGKGRIFLGRNSFDRSLWIWRKHFVFYHFTALTAHHYIKRKWILLTICDLNMKICWCVESMTPTGQVNATTSRWSIRYTSNVIRPSITDIFIRFYAKSTGREVHVINVRTDETNVQYLEGTLLFLTRITWTEVSSWMMMLREIVMRILL